jgi:hypothetical protein
MQGGAARACETLNNEARDPKPPVEDPVDEPPNTIEALAGVYAGQGLW